MRNSNLKLFQHYKSKPYKYLGTARHSESLEELVLYETRYDNELGALWVRPKQMFFEDVEVDGKNQPRFERVPIKITESEQVTAEDKVNILNLLDKVFGGYSASKLESTLKNRKATFLVVAKRDGEFIGFKLGYTYNEERFYSWIGAVAPTIEA